MMTDRPDPRRTQPPLRTQAVPAGCGRKPNLSRTFGLVALALIAGRTAAAQTAETVDVLYAGSLVNLMEHGVGPSFKEATGDTFRGFAGGSNALANQIKGKLRQGDVFISANPMVDSNLMGPANGSWVSWYISFAESPLMIGYNASSRFAADFKTKPWYEVLTEPGVRIGRTDPKLDPKGALTLQLMASAEQFYHRPGLAQQVLGAPQNPSQILPEETLVGRIQSGQLDAGFFYSTETTDAGIPAVAPPAEIAPKAVYTVTILRDAPHASGARRFVAFLLGSRGQQILEQHGLALRKPSVSGDLSSVPPDIRALATGTR
jgi:molybdate/tungstate transport system substrate-binding protein